MLRRKHIFRGCLLPHTGADTLKWNAMILYMVEAAITFACCVQFKNLTLYPLASEAFQFLYACMLISILWRNIRHYFSLLKNEEPHLA